ncbi:MAG: glycosyltransferase [Candidatus Amulumruptor caecigallinarius]|nr:glycosyltransferase [Candidatus Amulumruptor caecigallinarius]MCM1396448.1 glycosyltransferase [Candidatus Amulumruptor caecigallinarius]MCM1453495.1 glycosyltransferase [bacterium]
MTTQPRHILFVMSRFLDGGIDTILVEYLRALAAEGHRLTLAIGIKMEGMEPHLAALPESVEVVHLVDSPALTRLRRRKLRHRLSLPAKLYDEVLLNPMRRVMRRRRLSTLIARADAVVDFDASLYTDIAALTPAGKPVVGFYHFSIAENLRRSPRHTTRQMLGMAGYKAIALISDTMVEEGRQLFPQLAQKFTRIYNGYDIAALEKRGDAPLPASPLVEKLLQRRYFISVARLEESQKDITTLLHAYARLRGDLEEEAPMLALVGDGRDRQQLEALAAELGVGADVAFLGFQPDAAPWIKNALTLVHSSKYEGFGLVLVEAMIQKVPVVATDCPSGPAEVLDGGKAGILVPVGDTRTMARAMLVLATDPGWRAPLAIAAYNRSRAFDIRHSAQALLRAIFA